MDKIYTGKFASSYEQWGVGPGRKDVKFYLDYLKQFRGKIILEVGAGTGRITIPLLKAGLNVTALDISPSILKVLREKAKRENISAKIICADIRRLNLKDKFDAVVVPFRPFQHLYSVADQMNALKSIKKVLKPNGVLVFDIYNPGLKYIVTRGNWQWGKEGVINLPGKKKIKIYSRIRYDMAEQMQYQEYRFIYPNSERKNVILKMRFFFRFEIEHLLELAGFEVKNLYGDFNKSKFKSDSPEMIWVAQQA